MMETASETVMGKKRLAKYLASKPEGEYSYLDKILKAYADGEAARLLSKYEFYDTEFYCNLRRWGNDFQIVVKYYNLSAIMCFSEAGYFYVLYPGVKITNKRVKAFDQSVIYCGYEEDFRLETFLETIYEKLKVQPELVIGPIPKNRRKLYALLSVFFFLLPFVVAGGMALYGFANGISVYGDWWMVILFLGSAFLGTHFYWKAQK